MYDAYFNTTDGSSYIWNGSAWDLLAQAGADGQDGAGGTGLLWQGALEEAPENPELNWAYYNETDGSSYIWNGTSWDALTEAGAADMMTQQMTATATEDGILFEGMLLNNVSVEGSSTETKTTIRIWNNDNEMALVAENTKGAWDYDSWKYTYPLVEAGKEYSFNVAVSWHNTIICEKEFTVTAIGGLGEYKVENEPETEDDTYVSLSGADDTDRVLSREQQVFTANTNVPVLRFGTFYTLTSVSDGVENMWGPGNIWLYEKMFWDGGTEASLSWNLSAMGSATGDWRDFDYLDVKLSGRNLGVSTATRVEIAGYTYGGTVYFEMNDYLESILDWDDAEETGVFLVYGEYGGNWNDDENFNGMELGEEDGFYHSYPVPGAEKYYLLKDDTGYSFVEENTAGAMEVWGTFVDMTESIKDPVYIPDGEARFGEYADYCRFTGSWSLIHDYCNDDIYSYGTTLPCSASDFATSMAGNADSLMIDGKYVLAIAEPLFEQVKADYIFYSYDGEEPIKTVTGASYVFSDDELVAICPIPEKTDCEGHWGIGRENFVNHCYPIYEVVRITVNFLDSDGNVLYEPQVLEKPDYYDDYYYSDDWRQMYIPSIPSKEGYISDGSWYDENNHYSYHAEGSHYIYTSEPTVNLVAQYREAQKRTAYFYDSDETTLLHTIVCTETEETQYSSDWYMITIPALPTNDDGKTASHWYDKNNGYTCFADSGYDLYGYDSYEFVAVY